LERIEADIHHTLADTDAVTYREPIEDPVRLHDIPLNRPKD
jgi:hypothetical protein